MDLKNSVIVRFQCKCFYAICEASDVIIADDL